MDREKNIYVLEDDPDIRAIIKYILTRSGYTVLDFENVTAFKQQLEKDIPDLFIMDVQLPDGNGLAISSELSAQQDFAGIPILMMSADIFNKNKAAAAGVQHFISKPFLIDNFLDSVEHLLAA